MIEKRKQGRAASAFGISVRLAIFLLFVDSAHAASMFELTATANPLVEALEGPQFEGSGSVTLDMSSDGTFTEGVGFIDLNWESKDRLTNEVIQYTEADFPAPGQFLDNVRYTALGGLLTELVFVLVNDGNSLCLLGCTSFSWGIATEVAIFQPIVRTDLLFAVPSVSPVPVPAAVWLFGSGLLGLVGMSRRKKAA